MADWNGRWDHDGARQGHWRYPRFRWKLDAHYTVDRICDLMSCFIIFGNLLL